jgi:hypothetical protein
MKNINKNIDFSCNLCNKYYASQSSLCNHNNKFHKDNIIHYETKQYNCSYCNKIFKMRQYKWKHEQSCKIKNNIQENNNKQENNNLQDIKEQNKHLIETINELKLQVSMIIKEKGKIHHKTLQKINNQLNNINNGNIINNTFVKF